MVSDVTWYSRIYSCGYQNGSMFIPTCFDVADYFLAHCGEESGDITSNLRVQKLTYCAQGFFLALLDKPPFNERIKVRMHGLAVPGLYRKHKDCGNGVLPAPEDFGAKKFSEGETELSDEVYKVYGQFPVWKLRNITREEQLWEDIHIEDVVSQEITPNSMKDFLKTLTN